MKARKFRFQSTRPMRGATQSTGLHSQSVEFQSTRPMRGATPLLRGNLQPRIDFNPRAPYGARPSKNLISVQSYSISIHAPHAGRDRTRLLLTATRSNFNPRAPCGARHVDGQELLYLKSFQSTRPMRGATGAGGADCPASIISIHAPHAGRDLHRHRQRRVSQNFNPRAPCGARRTRNITCGAWRRFQSTRPMRGATLENFILPFMYAFQSTRPMRGATFLSLIQFFSSIFQSTRPMRGATA